MTEAAESLGPAMSALTERQRAFVVTFIEFPTLSHVECARRAGYPDNGENAKVVAHRLLTSERVLKALNEELDKRFRRDAVLGRSVLLEIAQDKEHPQRLKAAEALLNRGGFGVLHEQRIRVEHSDMSSEAMIERIRALAHSLGLDAAALVGFNAAPKLIEAAPVEAAPASIEEAS
jgi:phage terminase small subunit